MVVQGKQIHVFEVTGEERSPLPEEDIWGVYPANDLIRIMFQRGASKNVPREQVQVPSL